MCPALFPSIFPSSGTVFNKGLYLINSYWMNKLTNKWIIMSVTGIKKVECSIEMAIWFGGLGWATLLVSTDPIKVDDVWRLPSFHWVCIFQLHILKDKNKTLHPWIFGRANICCSIRPHSYSIIQILTFCSLSLEVSYYGLCKVNYR